MNAERQNNSVICFLKKRIVIEKALSIIIMRIFLH